MNTKRSKRVTMKLKCPNPLFEQWLTEWRDKAIESDSKMQHCFAKALQSLRRYPLQLESGRDCKILQGFGSKLCQMIDTKLKQYKGNNCDCNDSATVIVNQKQIQTKHQRDCVTKTQSSTCSPNTSSARKQYIPSWGSGAYAILVSLYTKSLESDYPGYLHKVDVIKHGQCLCNKSFTKPDPGTYYTAWSSMKTLLEKKLVTKQGSPAEFSLTDAGYILAQKLSETKDTECIIINKMSSHSNAQAELNIQSLPNEELEKPLVELIDETFIFAPCTFQIILLIDKQETVSHSTNPFDNYTLTELKRHNIAYEVRHLKVGDYVWVCRHQITNKELVLPYIVERKRMDDFGSSIKDGRFHEQKFRLKQCGIQNLVYLIENYGNNTHIGLPLNTLYQAATNTLLQDGFDVKFTDGLKGTTDYFIAFTTILKNIFEKKTLVSCPKENLTKSSINDDIISLVTFPEFNKGASKIKNFKVRDLFIRQLIQLKGLSVEKAVALTGKYPTPQALQTAYNNQRIAGEKMLSTVQFGKLEKTIGPVISNTLYNLYRNDKF